MSGSIEAVGADVLARTAYAAADALRDLEPAFEQMGDVLLADVEPPVITGRLAESLYVRTADDEVILASDLRYAAIVNARTPFLTRVLEATEDTVVDLFVDAVSDVVATIQGA